MAATGGMLLSLLLTWYSVTITAVGMQFYQSFKRALLYRLFPAAASGVGGLSGPLTISVSALSKEAGGWRWAILVVSIVLILEVLLAIGSGVARQAAPSWPHATILLALCVVNLVLVGAAFFNLPYSDVPSSYISVSHGVGSYLGLGGASGRAWRRSGQDRQWPRQPRLRNEAVQPRAYCPERSCRRKRRNRSESSRSSPRALASSRAKSPFTSSRTLLPLAVKVSLRTRRSSVAGIRSTSSSRSTRSTRPVTLDGSHAMSSAKVRIDTGLSSIRSSATCLGVRS